jgi:hypothetical protein
LILSVPVLVVTVLLAVAVAVLIYLRQEKLGLAGVGLAALRTLGLGALLLLLWNPGCARLAPAAPPVVLLDRSLSMGVAGGHWTAAVDTAGRLAGADGTVLGFGARVSELESTEPTDGVSRMREALTVHQALGRPAIVVTDGEVADAGSLTPGLLHGVQFVVLPRDTVAGAALQAVEVPTRVARGDSVFIAVTVAVWGDLPGDSLTLECWESERRLLSRTLAVPATPATLRRQLVLQPGALGIGARLLTLRVTAAGDREARDNERQRVVAVMEQPAIVVIVDPADWEGRFLVQLLDAISGQPVRGFARVGEDAWIDMRSVARSSTAQVRRAARQASLVVVRGSDAALRDLGRQGPVWRWPAAGPDSAAVLEGDWYVQREMPVSPIVSGLARLEWDSLPPLTGVLSYEPGPGDWVALTAQRGRRGSAQPVLLGRESARQRELITLGMGFWRWAFRGGAGIEAARAMLAAGVDWLLESDGARDRVIHLVSGPVATRGTPLMFQWHGDTMPDSLVLRVMTNSGETLHALPLDARGRATLSLDPGVYRWVADGTGASGIAVVEEFSDEFLPQQVARFEERVTDRAPRGERFPRQRWWLFFVAVLAFAGEWAWRQRRGLP